MRDRLQLLIDNFYYARQHAVTTLAYFTLRVYGIEVTYNDVREGNSKSRTYTPLSLEDVKGIDTLLAISTESLSNAEKRRTVVTDKCKTLLTLGSLLLGVVGLLLPKYLAFDFILMRGLAVFAIAILFNAIVILLMFFDVGQEMEMKLEQADVALDEHNLKKSVLNNNLNCAVASDNRTDYLVDLYRAARFCFLSALTIIAGLVLFSLLINAPSDQTERVVREIRSDPTLMNLLRGPQGLEGKKGDQGLLGSKGDKGEQGIDVSIDDIVERLIKDVRLQDAIEKAILRKQTSKATQP